MKKKKKPFEISDKNRKTRSRGSNSSSRRDNGETKSSAIAKVGFFADPGVRETIESIVVAVMLALLFRAYEAEAFVIPTGSMAPTLQGRHLDIECDECGHQFRVGASSENPERQPKYVDASGKVEIAPLEPWITGHATCPICRYTHRLKRNVTGWKTNRDSFYGDRIIVSKFAYEIASPKRWDVVVFKYPGNAKQNYIKRLVGLPGETVKLEFGNVYVRDGRDFKIVRKPHHKLKAMLQLVDDTHHVAESLKEVGWPSRWNEWSSSSDARAWQIEDGEKFATYQLQSTDETKWLRYRHIVPNTADWLNHIERGELPPRLKDFKGQLIADFYSYNFFVPRSLRDANDIEDWMNPTYESNGRYLPYKQGVHWVADLAIESMVEVLSSDGELKFDLVKAGAKYTCTIDIETGRATLSCSDSDVVFLSDSSEVVEVPEATTPIRGKGTYRIRYANVDDQLYLWVNEKVIHFDASAYENFQDRYPVPKYTATDPADAEPAGIGGRNAELKVTRLKILRDVYYINTRTGAGYSAAEYRGYPTSYLIGSYENSVFNSNRFSVPIRQILEDPLQWSTERGQEFFSMLIHDSPEYYYELDEDQFMPLGDNSPSSMDSRAWNHGHFFDRKYLIGKALFIYWPHAWRQPFFFPNFQRMGFIR